MVRPRKKRQIGLNPKAYYFKPQGVPLRELQVEKLLPEELEAMRLKNVEGMEQIQAAAKMGISQSTFQRILAAAYNKISLALINGRAIEIEK